MCLVALEAEAAHAAVELDVDGHLLAGGNGSGRISLCDLKIGHGLRDAVLENAFSLILGREAEHQDGELHAVDAQFHRLVDVGDGKIGRTDLFKMLGNAHRAVTVGVRLDHAEELCLFAHLRADDVQIVRQIVKVDLRPCSSKIRFHCKAFFLIGAAPPRRYLKPLYHTV